MLKNEEIMHTLEKGEITLDEALGQLTGERATDNNGLAIAPWLLSGGLTPTIQLDTAQK